MSIDRDVLEAVREMDEHELRRLYILAKVEETELEPVGKRQGFIKRLIIEQQEIAIIIQVDGHCHASNNIQKQDSNRPDKPTGHWPYHYALTHCRPINID